MELDTAKAICLVSLFVSTWLFTCAPYFLVTSGTSNPKYVRIRDTAISYLKCYAGGIFMAACFLNLLPSGMRAMDQYYLEVGITSKFPAFMCIAALGFFTIAIVELLAHSLIRKAGGDSHDHVHQHDGCTKDHIHQNSDANRTEPSIQIPRVSSGTAVVSNGVSSHGNGIMGRGEISKISVQYDKQDSLEMTEIYQNQDKKCVSLIMVPNGETNARASFEQTVEADHGHDEVKDMLTVMEANPLRAFLLLAALSFHTIFDGLAIGLETTESEMWQMFTAIIMHKSLVSICLGLQLFLQYKDRPLRGFLWSLFFATIAPIGLGIGMATTSGDIDETARLLTNTFLQGLATGTFIFVTFFEILKEEIVDKKGFKRLLLVALGFTTMGVIKYLL